MIPDLVRRVEPRIGDVGGIEFRYHFFAAPLREGVLDQCHHFSSRRRTLGVVVVARVLGQFSAAQHLVAKVRPLAFILNAEQHVAIIGAETAVGHDGRVVWPAAAR